MAISTTFQSMKEKFRPQYWKSIEEFEEYYLRDLAERLADTNYYTDKDGVERKIPPINHFPELKEYEVWMEGYAATGEQGTATLVGRGTGETFDEAVRDYMSKTPNHGIEEVTRNRYSSEENYNNRKSNWHIWACRLFDNEADARKSFG